MALMGTEPRELLMALDDIERVVDIEHHGLARSGIARAMEIDQYPAEPDQIAQARCVLEPRQGGLARQRRAAFRHVPAGELQGGVGAQRVEIIGGLLASGDGEDPRWQDPAELVQDARRTTATPGTKCPIK